MSILSEALGMGARKIVPSIINVLKKSLPKTGKITEEVNPLEFANTITNAINVPKGQFKIGDFLTQYTPEEYAGMKTFLTPDKTAGYALKPLEEGGNELVSVFSTTPGGGIGKALASEATLRGATKLDNYSINNVLPKLYGKAGFKETSRSAFDPAYADPNASKALLSAQPEYVAMELSPKHIETLSKTRLLTPDEWANYIETGTIPLIKKKAVQDIIGIGTAGVLSLGGLNKLKSNNNDNTSEDNNSVKQILAGSALLAAGLGTKNKKAISQGAKTISKVIDTESVPSALSKTITSKLNSIKPKVTTSTIVSKVKGKEVLKTKTKKQLFINEDQYPPELKNIGLKPISGLDYLSGTQIKELPREQVIDEMASNIDNFLKYNIDNQGINQALIGKDFYNTINKAQKKLLTGEPLTNEEFSALSAAFSPQAKVKDEIELAVETVRNPFEPVLPGNPRGIKSKVNISNDYKNAVKILINENKLDPFNLNAKGKLVKVPSYAENRAIPKTSKAVTIDRHASQMVLGVRGDEFVNVNLGDAYIYGLFKDAFTKVAKNYDLKPHELQAATWNLWRQLMLKYPGAISPEKYLPKSLEVNELFKLPESQRKIRLIDSFNKEIKDKTNDKLQTPYLLDLINLIESSK